MSPLTISLIVAALIIIASIVFLIVHIVKTIKGSQETLKQVNGTMTNFEKQTEGITTEISSLTDKADVLSKDFSQKSSKLDNMFFGLDNIKEVTQQFIQAIKDLSANLTNFSDQDVMETEQVLLWGKDLLTSKEKTE